MSDFERISDERMAGLPEETQQKFKQYDTLLEQVLIEYHRKPYTGADPHGYFPYVLAIVSRLCGDDIPERVRMLVAVTAVADIVLLGQQDAPEPTPVPEPVWHDL